MIIYSPRRWDRTLFTCAYVYVFAHTCMHIPFAALLAPPKIHLIQSIKIPISCASVISYMVCVCVCVCANIQISCSYMQRERQREFIDENVTDRCIGYSLFKPIELFWSMYRLEVNYYSRSYPSSLSFRLEVSERGILLKERKERPFVRNGVWGSFWDSVVNCERRCLRSIYTRI